MSMSDLYSTLSKCLECKFLSISDEVLSLEPVCLKIDFRCKILKYQCQIRTQRL